MLYKCNALFAIAVAYITTQAGHVCIWIWNKNAMIYEYVTHTLGHTRTSPEHTCCMLVRPVRHVLIITPRFNMNMKSVYGRNVALNSP